MPAKPLGMLLPPQTGLNHFSLKIPGVLHVLLVDVKLEEGHQSFLVDKLVGDALIRWRMRCSYHWKVPFYHYLGIYLWVECSLK